MERSESFLQTGFRPDWSEVFHKEVEYLVILSEVNQYVD